VPPLEGVVPPPLGLEGITGENGRHRDTKGDSVKVIKGPRGVRGRAGGWSLPVRGFEGHSEICFEV